MFQILKKEKQQQIERLNEVLETIKSFSLYQDIEENNQRKFTETWHTAHAIAQNIDSINYLLILALPYYWPLSLFLFLIFATYMLLFMYVHVETLLLIFSAQLTKEEKRFVLAPNFLFKLFFLNIPWIFIQNFLSLKVHLLFNSNKTMVSTTFEHILKYNYVLQKQTEHFHTMQSDLVSKYFKRNHELSLGLLWNADQEIQQINNRLLDRNTILEPAQAKHLLEAHRLFIAIDEYHNKSCPITALHNLVDLFTSPYFQAIADKIISEILLIHIPKLCSNEEKNRFYKLMGHYSKRQPDSPGLCMALSYFKDSEIGSIPNNWQNDIDVTTLPYLNDEERREILEQIINTYPQKKLSSTRKNYCFFANGINNMHKISLDTADNLHLKHYS